MSIPRSLSPSAIQPQSERASGSGRPSIIQQVRNATILPQSLQLQEQPQKAIVPSIANAVPLRNMDHKNRNEIKKFALNLLEKKLDKRTVRKEILKKYNIKCNLNVIVQWGIKAGSLLNASQRKQEYKKLQAEALRLSVEEQMPAAQIAIKYEKDINVIYRWLREAREQNEIDSLQQATQSTTLAASDSTLRLFENESYAARAKIKAFAIGLIEKKIAPAIIIIRIKNKFRVACQLATIDKWQTKVGLPQLGGSDEQLQETDKLEHAQFTSLKEQDTSSSDSDSEIDVVG